MLYGFTITDWYANNIRKKDMYLQLQFHKQHTIEETRISLV